MSDSSRPSDGPILFVTRILRLIAYGAISLILALYLQRIGFSEGQIGLLLCLTLVGDAAISFWLTTRADLIGRKKSLIVGAILMILGGIAFAVTHDPILLLIAATIGVISPSGNEVGPFLSIEQAALSQVVEDRHRTRIFAWYSLAGSLATAVGSMIGGLAMQWLSPKGETSLLAFQVVLFFYAGCGVLLAILFAILSSAVEAPPLDAEIKRPFFGLHKSKSTVLKLAALFSIDAFGGGFVVQSLLTLWFSIRFQTPAAMLGTIFFFANAFAGISHLAAAWLAKRIGLINTMVFTHLPSNVLLMLVPLMPNFWLAVIVLLMRFAISQMDVPTRQSYSMAVVDPSERSAAAGVTSVARTIGASISPLLAGPMLGVAALVNMPLFLAGGAKIVYDVLLYRSFTKIKPPEET